MARILAVWTVSDSVLHLLLHALETKMGKAKLILAKWSGCDLKIKGIPTLIEWFVLNRLNDWKLQINWLIIDYSKNKQNIY